MSSITESELAKLMARNPELSIADSGQPPASPTVAAKGQKQGHISEYDLQKAVIALCDEKALESPLFGLVMAVPNGQYRQGQRMEPGLRSGVPDLFLPVARRGQHGLWIELKVGDNKPSANQLKWAAALRHQGYSVALIYGDPQTVIDVIGAYLEGEL